MTNPVLKVRSMTPAQVGEHLHASERRVVQWFARRPVAWPQNRQTVANIDAAPLATFLEARANRPATTKAQPGALQKKARIE
jgi:hypothetical protein